MQSIKSIMLANRRMLEFVVTKLGDIRNDVVFLGGRLEIVDEIQNTDNELRDHLISSFTEIDNSPAFKGAIQGHFVQYGSFADGRIAIVERKINEITGK